MAASSGMTAVAVNLSNNADIDGLLWGYKWSQVNLTYSFPTSSAEYLASGYKEVDGFQALTPVQIAAEQRALADYSAVCGLTFTAVTTTGANLRFGSCTKYDSNNGAGDHIPGNSPGTAEANPVDPGNPTGSWGDAWFSYGENPKGNDNSNPQLGNLISTAAFMHELGHNLGLKHGQASQSAHGSTFPTLPADHDSQEYSIMTYDTYPGAQGGTQQYPETPMQDDVAALQYMYGANYTTHAGATIYKWNATTGEESIKEGASDFVAQGAPAQNHIFETVWDGGGNDTYDFSNYTTHLSINLNPGEWINLGTQLADLDTAHPRTHIARGNIANALLYQNNARSLVENAIGGSGADTITGNAADNTLEGGAGGDTIDGGAGSDTVSYHHSSAAVNVDLGRLAPGPDQYLPRGGDAQGDVLISIENIIGSDHDDRLVDVATGNVGGVVSGGGGNDTIFGSAFDDTLYGGVQNLVRDGSFEIVNGLTAESTGYYLGSTTSVDSWGLASGSHIELFSTSSTHTPTDGQYGVDLSANPGKTAISQTLQGVKAGVLYRLAFDAQATAGSGAKLDIKFDGADHGTIVATAAWTTYFVDVYGDNGAGANLNQLVLSEVGTNNFDGTRIDNVRMFDASLSDPTADGADFITTNGGSDVVYGNGGDDTAYFNKLDTTHFVDQFDGGSGTDTLWMDWSTDTTAIKYDAFGILPAAANIGAAAAYATGSDGASYLFFRDVEKFKLYGGSGDDTLVGGTGNDELHGGAGNDILYGDGGVDILDGGAGYDTVVLDSSQMSGTHIVLKDTENGGTVKLANGTTLTSIEAINLTAGAGDDYLDVRGTVAYNPTYPWINAQPTYFDGSGGNDTLAVDLMTSYGAHYDGGAGDDLLIMDWSQATFGITLDTSSPTSSVYSSYAYSSTVVTNGGSFTTNYYFTVTYTNVERFNLTGGSAADTLYGGAFNDVLNPGRGFQDGVDGGAGVDTMIVDYHLDNYVIRMSLSADASAGGGYDGSIGNAQSASDDFTSFSHIEKFQITTGGGADVIYGGDYGDTISTGAGDDSVYAGTGYDTVDLGTGVNFYSDDLSAQTANVVLNLTNVTSFQALGTGGLVKGADNIDLKTGSGNDTITTRTDFLVDTIATGAGDDLIKIYAGFGDSVDGGAGVDTLAVDYHLDTYAINMALNADAGGGYDGSIGNGQSASDDLVNYTHIEKFVITTGVGNDVIYGGDYGDVISTGDGDDSVYAGLGKDTVDLGAGVNFYSDDLSAQTASITLDLTKTTVVQMLGTGGSVKGAEYVNLKTGSGNDTIITRTDFLVDTLATGAGDDLIKIYAGFGDSVDGGAGVDTLAVDYHLDTYAINMALNADAGGGYDGSIGNGQSASDDLVRYTHIEKFVITTGGGNDVIYGGDYGDVISTGAGDDSVYAGKGKDSVDLGTGVNFYQDDLSAQTVSIYLNLTNTSSVQTLGTGGFVRGADYVTLTTGSGNDVIVTRSDFLVDTIATGAGDDTIKIYAGFGDSVDGGAGVDTLLVDYRRDAYAITLTLNVDPAVGGGYDGSVGNGQSASDDLVNYTHIEKFNVTTGSGNDVIYGGDYGDVISTGDGDDSVYAGLGKDTVDLGAGVNFYSDDVSAQNANVILNLNNTTTYQALGVGGIVKGAYYVNLKTGVGNDTITTRSDFLTDTISTGAGNDTIKIYAGFSDSVDGGAGTDTLLVDYHLDAYGINMSYSADPAVGGGYDGSIGNGASASDDLVNFSHIEVFQVTGGSGNDNLTGGGGADTLFGKSGDDTLVGGAGVNYLDGGAGADSFDGTGGTSYVEYIDATKTVTLDLNKPSNSINDAAGDTFVDIAGYIGSNFSDRMVAGAAGVRFYGGLGYDTLLGGTGNDFLFGQAGDDTLRGGAGLNYLDGGAGADVLDGTGGTSYADYRDATAAVTLNLATGAYTGDALGDKFTNIAGYYGTNFDDTLTAGAAGTHLFGWNGADTLNGGAGADFLIGGLGADTMTGGGGADQFIYGSALEGGDTITDFSHAQGDTFLMSHTGFGGKLPSSGALPAAQFGTTATATTASGVGEFLWNAAASTLSWDSDGVGAGAAVGIATLTGVTTLTAADIRLY